MKLLLLVLFAGCTFASVTAQTHEQSAPLSEDSIQRIFAHIDELSFFELKKVRESYIYKNRTAPSEDNQRILLYVEEKYQALK